MVLVACPGLNRRIIHAIARREVAQGPDDAGELMNWGGKIAGAALGLVAGGPLGILVGALIGHQFDRGWRGIRTQSFEGLDARVQSQLFAASFQLMGYLAKADGRISEAEIRAARAVMHEMRLEPARIRQAINHFTAGKQPGFVLAPVLAQLSELIGREPALCRGFVELQLRVLRRSGSIAGAQRGVLWQVASALGLSRVELAQLEAAVWAGAGQRTGTAAEISAAYALLGVPAEASDQELKVAYRRLMNRHHPDKLAGRGESASLTDAAKDKTREVRAAYEALCRHRGLR